MDLDPWLPRAAALRPDHPALIDTAGSVTTYAELHADALDAAAVLQAKGVERGDRVALALPAGAPFLAALHAAFMLGAAIVPIDLRLGPSEQEVRTVGAKLTVEQPLRREGEPDARTLGRLDPDAPATVVHTSGTTADPKPVVAHGRQLGLERARLRARARARPAGPLAVHAAAQPRRRPGDPDSQRDLRHDRRAARALRHRGGADRDRA